MFVMRAKLGRGGAAAEVERFVWEEILAAAFRGDVARPDIRSASSRKAFRIARGREHPEVINVRFGGDCVPHALFTHIQPVDFLETARAVRKERLPGFSIGALGAAHSSSQAWPSACRAIYGRE